MQKNLAEMPEEEAKALAALLCGCQAPIPASVMARLEQKRFVMRWKGAPRLGLVGLLVALKLSET